MEHFQDPFTPDDLLDCTVVENRKRFSEVLARSNAHGFFAHRFLSAADGLTPAPEWAGFVLTSFYGVVEPFTGLLCTLAAKAPNLRSRFLLLDNLYEEMGRGDFRSAHPNLYLTMLESIGVDQQHAEAAAVLPAIRRIHEHLEDVIQRQPFAVGCAVLAAAEATIPTTFPVLARLAQRAYPSADMGFFARHGARDEGHAHDACLLFALNASAAHIALAEAEIAVDLSLRRELFDAWLAATS